MRKLQKCLIITLAVCIALLPLNVFAEEAQGPVYRAVTARFVGDIEPNAKVMVLENDTAIELGYVEQLISAFNEAYKDYGVKAERALIPFPRRYVFVRYFIV
ncbi:MAG: hypothetical protein LBD16_03640 [Oscillospiraceae bacterium]|jgi:hypothetical protein|nr:hypothetical protein [Oscillospiraceae bacterium]